MTHRNYTPRKPGLIDRKIGAEKALRLLLNSCVMGQHELHSMIKANEQRAKLSYSDQGDFTGVYRGGFY